MANGGTDVVPDSVSNFGLKALDEATALAEGSVSTVGGIGAARGGASGLPEGVSFAHAHAAHVQRLLMFNTDALAGLGALAKGGVTIAQNYRNADAAQAGEMDHVGAAFDAAGAPLTSARRSAEGATATAAFSEQAAAYMRPPSTSQSAATPTQPKPLPAPQAPVLGPPMPTPKDQVDSHTSKYGKHENWKPTPPKPPAPPPPATTPTGTTIPARPATG